MSKLAESPSTGIKRLARFRFRTLFVAMVLIFFYAPFVDLFSTGFQPTVARVTLTVLFVTQLLSSVFAISRDRTSLLISIALVSPVILAQLADAFLARSSSYVASHLLAAVFLAYVSVLLLRVIFDRQDISTDTIFAALCVFLLLGVIWACAYSLLETFHPGSFYYTLTSGEHEARQFGRAEESMAIYYSFVTMTTLGYGDIIPITSAARAMATLQAVVGQLYLAVLVARLVGLHVAVMSSAGRDK